MKRDAPIIVETFSHATEDIDKVKKAILALFPEEYHEKIKIEEEYVTGHWNNPIVILRVKIIGSLKDIFLKRFSHLLSNGDKDYLKRTLHLRLDNAKNLYLRINKQAAYKGLIFLDERKDDVIKIKIPLVEKWSDKKRILEKLEKMGIVS